MKAEKPLTDIRVLNQDQSAPITNIEDIPAGTFFYATVGEWQGLYFMTKFNWIVMIKAKYCIGNGDEDTGTVLAVNEVKPRVKNVSIVDSVRIITKGNRTF